MTYQLYRNTTLGNTLQETLDDLLQVNDKKIKLKNCSKILFAWFFLVWPNNTPAGFQDPRPVWQGNECSTLE